MDQFQAHGRALEVRPTAITEQDVAVLRTNKYGELMLDPAGWRSRLAQDGRYFRFRTAAPGTGVATHADPGDTYTATLASVYVRNDYTDGKKLVLDYIKLQVIAAAGTNGTNFGITTVLDEAATTRFPTSGTVETPVGRPPYMGSTDTATVTVKVGAATVPAASSNARIQLSELVRTVIPVIGDTYLVAFGREIPDPGGEVISGTAPVKVLIPHPPVVLGSLEQFLLYEYSASQSVARQFEFEMGAYVL